MSGAPREPRMSVDVLRAAAQRAVDASSSHQVAKAVEMSALGLRKFLRGAEPHPGTVTKLTRWYVRHAAEHGHIDAETIAAALVVLLDGYPENERESVRREILGLLRETHRKLGTHPPGWLAGE